MHSRLVSARNTFTFPATIAPMSEKTIVIVPTYNERENLPPLVERLMKLPVEVDLLVVDDNSPDGTGKIADEIGAKNPRVHVMHRQIKNGLGRAYIDGFK